MAKRKIQKQFACICMGVMATCSVLSFTGANAAVTNPINVTEGAMATSPTNPTESTTATSPTNPTGSTTATRPSNPTDVTTATGPTAPTQPEKKLITTISSVQDLRTFADTVNSGESYEGLTVTLAEDIDLDEVTKWQDAHDTTGETYSWLSRIDNFAGTFEGNGHCIKGIWRDENSEETQGLFGELRGTVKNLTVRGKISGYIRIVGGIAAVNKGSIINCYSEVELDTLRENAYIGGLAGQNEGIIRNCINRGKVKGYCENIFLGGLIGNAESGSIIENSYNQGEIYSYEDCKIGGLIGMSDSAEVYNCFNAGKIKGDSQKKAASLVYYAAGNSSFTNCYGITTGSKKLYIEKDKSVSFKKVYTKKNNYMRGAAFCKLLNKNISNKSHLASWKYSGGYPVFETGYGITYKEAEHGTIVQLSETGWKNRKTTIELKPEKGYEALSMSVINSNGEKISTKRKEVLPTKTEANSAFYTFTMPDEGVTIEAKFVPLTKKASSLKAKASSKTVKCTWKASDEAEGYLLQYAEVKKGKVSGSWKKAADVKKTVKKYTVKKLKKGKTYQFCVYAYRNVEGEKIYSNAILSKKVKVK